MIRFIMFFGFYSYLLENGPNIAETIIYSMVTIGKKSSITEVDPTTFINTAFDIFEQLIDNASITSPINSAFAALIAIILLIIMALIAANLTIEYCAAWVLLYGGLFFLGFGATRWTSDMAINYFKAVLGAGVRIFSMILILGVAIDVVGNAFSSLAISTTTTIDASSSMFGTYTKTTIEPSYKEYAVVLVYSLIIFSIMNKVPSMLSNLVGGGSAVSSMGLGAVMGAAGIGAAAGSVAGSILSHTPLASAPSAVSQAIANTLRAVPGGIFSGGGSDGGGLNTGGGSSSNERGFAGLGESKYAAPADPPQTGVSGPFSGGMPEGASGGITPEQKAGGQTGRTGKGAGEYFAQGVRELGADLEKGAG